MLMLSAASDTADSEVSLIRLQGLIDLVWLLYPSPTEILFSLEKGAEGGLWLANAFQLTLSHDPFPHAGTKETFYSICLDEINPRGRGFKV